MHNAAMISCYRRETPWLVEWLEYHMVIGFEHFYLYCNDENVAESAAVLEPYVAAGLVTLKHDPAPYVQQRVYKEINRCNTEWLAVVDLDQLIVPAKHDDIRDYLRTVDAPGVVINWMLYGTSGNHDRPATQINHLLRRAPADAKANWHLNNICRPSIVDPNGPWINGHVLPYYENPVTTAGVEHKISVTNDAAFSSPLHDTCYLNHYVLRSRVDYEIKRQRGVSDGEHSGPSKFDSGFFDAHDCNDVFDDTISRRFSSRLRYDNFGRIASSLK